MRVVKKTLKVALEERSKAFSFMETSPAFTLMILKLVASSQKDPILNETKMKIIDEPLSIG